MQPEIRQGQPLYIHIDQSPIPHGEYASLQCRDWEERMRFAAGMRDFLQFEQFIQDKIKPHTLFFWGSGDFHHLSYLTIKNCAQQQIHVVVFDNHPDNMIYFTGIHCGSWVYQASMLPNVAQISVFGITSSDISPVNIWQNRLQPLKSGKVKYYCLKPVSPIVRWLSHNHIFDISGFAHGMAEQVRQVVEETDLPVYLSIDKDVCNPLWLPSTWDQGIMTETSLIDCIKAVLPRTVAMDVTGEISYYTYKNFFKKAVRQLDGESKKILHIEEAMQRHLECNRKLTDLFLKK